MDRRDFVAGSMGGALASALTRPDEAAAAEGGGRPLLLELRRYQFRFGPMETRFAEYAKGALVPVLNRSGVKPVGAFTVMFGADSPAVYLLLPHASADSVAALPGRIRADAEYQRAAATFRALPASDPPYVRRDSSLMAAFDAVPSVEAPSGPAAGPGRVFELRTYESHNENAALKKIEMFEKAGEIAIFRRLGMAPVFFGRNVVGPRLPSLTYMLVFADLAAREKSWGLFRDDPEWVKLRTTPGFSNAEILTNISVQMLRPTDYSQV
jgi:NIPSNAP